MFVGKQILIKEQAKNESEIVVSLTDKEYVFRSGVFTISSKDNPSRICLFYSYLISRLYEYYIYLIAGSWGTSTRPQIRLDEEYLSFPFLEPSETDTKLLLELINNLVKPYQGFYRKFNLGEPQIDDTVFKSINSVIESIYQIRDYQKDLISYVLDISRYQFQENKIEKVIRKIHTDNSVLESYADVFIEQLKDLYKDEYLQIEIYALDYFIAMNFVFKKEKPKQKVVFNQTETTEKEVFKALSNNLTIAKVSEKIFVQKDIKGFEENSFYIIKPNEYKCWHRAMAWYDVAEIKKTIEDAEIDYLKDSFND